MSPRPRKSVSLHGYAPEGINSFADWAARLERQTIVTEHGITYTPAEMIEMAKERTDRSGHHCRCEDPDYFLSEGVRFSRHVFC